MFKKILLPAVLIAAMLTFNTAAFAEPNRSIARRLDVTTFERNQVISGRAENGSEITMTSFWFKADEDKSILSKKKASDDDIGQWIVQGTSSWEVGASEIFAKPITLNPGKNRIVINVKNPEGSVKAEEISEVIDVEVVSKNELTDFINSIIMKNIKK